MAVRLHRAMFEDSESDEDDDSTAQTKVNSDKDSGIFSVSANLTQRKQQRQEKPMNGADSENRMMMNEDLKISDAGFELADSASFASTSRSSENFKRSINNPSSVDGNSVNDLTGNTRVKKLNNNKKMRNDDGKTQSFVDYMKSLFRCKKTRRFNEQIESDYPMNLHLRMNEIFAMHDKLSDIAEDLNDLYSIGIAAILKIN